MNTRCKLGPLVGLGFSTFLFAGTALAQIATPTAATAPVATPDAAATAPAAPTAPARRPQAPVPPNSPIGTPEGVARIAGGAASDFPLPNMVEGQPVETRPPELEGDHALIPGGTRAPYHKSVDFKTTLITDQLKSPWSIAILPDGKILATEKVRADMRLIDPATGAVSDPVSGLPEISVQAQVGLLDLALDPKFAKNKRIFFTYTEPYIQRGASVEDNRIAVASATFSEAALSLSDVKVIFRAHPSLPKRMGVNAGGKIVVAKDGSLFFTVGDRAGSPPWDMAQHLDVDLGKIIHINADGSIPKNNPFQNKAAILPEIWSYGHRSEEAITFDNNGRLWEMEDGPRGGDKLLHPEAGKNYGWPLYVHGIDYPGEKISGGAIEAEGTEQPVYFFDPAVAPSGMAFYHGKLFPAWKNSLFFGELRTQNLIRLEIKDGKVVAEEPLMTDQKTRIRDVRVGADGAVYVLSDYGKIWKLTPQ